MGEEKERKKQEETAVLHKSGRSSTNITEIPVRSEVGWRRWSFLGRFGKSRGVWAQGDDLESTGQTNRRREREAGRHRDEIVFVGERGREGGRPEEDTVVTGDKGLQERAAGCGRLRKRGASFERVQTK
jgi:hypothetical protein